MARNEEFREWVDLDQRLGQLYRDALRDMGPTGSIIRTTIDACFVAKSTAFSDVAMALIGNLKMLSESLYQQELDRAMNERIVAVRSDGSMVFLRESAAKKGT